MKNIIIGILAVVAIALGHALVRERMLVRSLQSVASPTTGDDQPFVRANGSENIYYGSALITGSYSDSGGLDGTAPVSFVVDESSRSKLPALVPSGQSYIIALNDDSRTLLHTVNNNCALGTATIVIDSMNASDAHQIRAHLHSVVSLTPQSCGAANSSN